MFGTPLALNQETPPQGISYEIAHHTNNQANDLVTSPIGILSHGP